MATAQPTVYVYIQLHGTYDWVPCASLVVRELGANLFEGTLTYGRRYLKRPNVVALDPFHLPLQEASHKVTKLKGIPGAVRDASPDLWGRRVIQAKLQRPEADISEIEYLLHGPDDGAGNLRFGRTVDPTPPVRRFNRTHQLQALIEAAQKLDDDGHLPHEVLEELEPGTSMGGARPKVAVEDGQRIWLAKLPERNDRNNWQRIEYATLELARAAGLDVCGTRLEPVGPQHVLMLERFDRQWNPDRGAYARFGLVSCLTVLDAEDGYLGRDRWSYLLLANELRRWSLDPDADRRELFHRMVFNAMVTNVDDHPRNHALLNRGPGWRLSPAYDIVPQAQVSQERRDLALSVGRFGRAASLYNLLSQTEVFGLARGEAQAEIDRMLEVVRGWREHYRAFGVDERDISMLEGAILPVSFFLTQPPEAFAP
jgi:serine/threonine-protein kinase HipA